MPGNMGRPAFTFINLYKYCNLQRKILTDSQHGFRTKRSCETQLILTLEDILKTTSKGKQIDIALLDFSKAFDKVPHQRLKNKLNCFGIRGNSSFLHNVHN